MKEKFKFNLKKYYHISCDDLINLKNLILGSPFTCSVSEAARVVVWSATEDKVAVGKIASFAVQCESSPQVQVLAPLRHSLPVTLIPATQPSTHNVQFTPVDVGKFILYFK